MTYDITPILKAIVELIFAITFIYIAPHVKRYYQQKFTQEERDGLEKAVLIAVEAAEQIYKAIPKSGATKKEYVLKVLAEQGYLVNTEEVDALIESKVLKLFSKKEGAAK